MDILSYILSKKNNGSNTGGSGEITNEQAYHKLFPKSDYAVGDISEMISSLPESGTTLGEIKLYYTDESPNPTKFEVSSLGVGSMLAMVTKINLTTMELNIYIYGTNNDISLEYNPSAFFESGYLVSLNSAVALTAITPTSGQLLITGIGFSSVVM